MKYTKVLLVFALALALGLLSFSLLPQGTAQAERGGGLLLKATPTTLASGATSYTTTANTVLTAINVFDYGSIQIQAAVDVTGSQVITFTPQFSNQPTVNCSAVTTWFTATAPLIFATSNITATTSFVNESVSITGDGNVGREVPTQGRCFRLSMDFSVPGQVYTPTVYVRPVNRY